MKHYQKEDWLDYKKGQVEEEKSRQMEDHLYNCQACLDIFLSTISEEEINQAGKQLDQNFNQRVISKISLPSLEGRKKKNQLISDYFLYYTAVAAVTIVLTGGGYFAKLVDGAEKLSLDMEEREKFFKPHVVYQLTEELTSKTADFINNFQIKEIKEENNEE